MTEKQDVNAFYLLCCLGFFLTGRVTFSNFLLGTNVVSVAEALRTKTQISHINGLLDKLAVLYIFGKKGRVIILNLL